MDDTMESREGSNIELIHICEVCGKEEVLTSIEARDAGWDYPPYMGSFGIVGPRTCPGCPITETLWWKIVAESASPSELSGKHTETLERILGEPQSILPRRGNQSKRG